METAAKENRPTPAPAAASMLALDLTVATVRPAVRAGLVVARHLGAATRPLASTVPRRPVEALARRGRPYRVMILQGLDARLDAVLAAVLDGVLRHVDVAAVLERHVDLDRLVAGVDLDAVVARMDLAALAEDVIADLDIAEIIRESMSTVSSETVREVRMRGIAADDLVSRVAARLRVRRPQSDASLTPAPGVAET